MTKWTALAAQGEAAKDRSILGLFADDPERFERFSARLGDMLLDLSKTAIDRAALDDLIALTEEAGLPSRREMMFSGAPINETEGRAVLHTALRAGPEAAIMVAGQDVMPGVRATRAAMARFAEAVRGGGAQGVGGRFTDVINIGIGGSDLGPAMAVQALAPYCDGPRVHFVSNVDSADIADTLAGLDPAKTLVIVASKTFTTIETMTNAATARAWLARVVPPERMGEHLAALSTAEDKTAAFGVPSEHVFGFEDWVGGRYSVWGPIGLSLMIAIGPPAFEAFLRGGAEMDTHFREAPPAENLPVLLALTGLWHANVMGYATRAVLPYDQRLSRLPAYLQQLDMESNGKGVAMDGSGLARSSGPIVWGEPGTNGQHAFYQLIHQGTRLVPCEFLVARQGHEPDLAHQHRLLLANCLAQSEALLRGRDRDAARALMAAKGLTGDELERQAAHRVFAGNRPSVTILYDKLDPRTLGRIIALYEHRVFVEGVVWGINSFDQWGVELGKELATAMLPLVEGQPVPDEKDGSTRGLLATL
ncbi:MAG: glucose-6-phosphate isomerase [Pseudomonadota bacterium]